MNFQIKKLTYAGELDGRNKVVTHVDWKAIKSDQEGNVAVLYGVTSLPKPENTFTDWKDLTEELVLNWLMAAMPESSKASIEENLNTKLGNMDRTDGSGLPW